MVAPPTRSRRATARSRKLFPPVHGSWPVLAGGSVVVDGDPV
jgi:hypothetical protein